MANHKSAEKAHKRSLVRAARNRARLSRIKTFIKKVEHFIEEGQGEAARTALRVAESELFKGVTKGVLKRNTASRKVSKMAQKVKAVCLANNAA